MCLTCGRGNPSLIETSFSFQPQVSNGCYLLISVKVCIHIHSSLPKSTTGGFRFKTFFCNFMALLVEENAQNLTSASVNLSLISDQKQPVHLFLYILSTEIHNKYCSILITYYTTSR